MAMNDGPRDLTGLASFPQSIADNCRPLSDPGLFHSFHSGRAAGIEAIGHAFSHVLAGQHEFVCVGGSDSYMEDVSLDELDESRRLLSAKNSDGFAPGEGAGFLLLTTDKTRALERDGHVIVLHKPGLAEEAGNLRSDDVYRGDGLDKAFKSALVNHRRRNIHCIYSSMNGESYWAKEMGVARIRNQQSISDTAVVHHPADCYGDLGAATAPVLIALAAEHLLRSPSARAALVYSSSDTATRGAIVIEKSRTVSCS